jgi:tetratricopeptide (TPR) repeat protein
LRFAAALLVCSLGAAAQVETNSAAYSKSPGYSAYQSGASLFAGMKFSESMAALDQALRLDPNLVPALTLKAKLAMSIKRFDVAQECLERALTVEPAAWYAQFLLGFSYYQQNEMPRAMIALEKARRLNPRDPRTLLYLGLAKETSGQTAEALALYREAIRLEEASGTVHVDTLLACSRLLMVLGDLDGCGSVIERALKLEPASRDAHFERGRLLLKQGRADDAAKEGETALRLHSGDIADRQVHYLLIQAYQASGREREAARHADALREIEKGK